jgi:hypothetical protein
LTVAIGVPTGDVVAGIEEMERTALPAPQDNNTTTPKPTPALPPKSADVIDIDVLSWRNDQ